VTTATGLALLEHARAMGTAAEALALAATGRSQAVGGVVSVSATEVVAATCCRRWCASCVSRTQALCRGDGVNALSDLLRREADIAIRHVKPDQPELIARLVREASACFYASEDWVQNARPPAHGCARGPTCLCGAPRETAVTWPTCSSTACR
jgi:DNA-binding transcriptional LysR family regulator